MSEPTQLTPRVAVEFPRSEALALAAMAELLHADEVGSFDVWSAALDGLARIERAVRVETQPGGDLAA